MPFPLSVEEAVHWVVGIPLSVEVIVVVPYLLCRGCVCWREELCTPSCITQILNGGSLCGKSCVDDIVKIVLCEGGDVKQWLEPRNISYCLRLIHYL